ncbi:MAG: hypothetical protein LCH41_04235 [Armatimonadetes bacterium]|nr:hypothetical protein [Armatimonadota bacterium]
MKFWNLPQFSKSRVILTHGQVYVSKCLKYGRFSLQPVAREVREEFLAKFASVIPLTLLHGHPEFLSKRLGSLSRASILSCSAVLG